MKNNRKGFTIVELVIVIAVIAILAAVLIPTFANLIKKANVSADQQAVNHMNKLLAMSDKAEDVDGVIAVLVENGYKGDLSTYFDGFTLAWVESENIIVLVENNAIAWPTKYVDSDLTFETINPMATDADALLGGLTDGKVIYVGSNLTVDSLYTETAGEFAVNLNGNTATLSGNVGSWTVGNKLILSNGAIKSTSEKIAFIVEGGGSAEVSNVQIYSASGANPIQCYGGDLVLNNVITAQSGEAEASWYNSAIQVVNKLNKNDDGSYSFSGIHAKTTINGGMYSGDKAVMMSSPGGTVIINDGTFIGTTNVIQADYYGNYAQQGAKHVVEINGGSFTGNIKIASGVTCTINGGTFSVNVSEVANVTIGAGKTVVDNGNGTWTVK